MRINNYQQFKESYFSDNLDLNSKEKIEIENNVYKTIYSMSDQEINSVFNELEKMTHKLHCTMEELSNPDFVKLHLDEINGKSAIEEGFFSDMKDKIFSFFSKVFEWGTALGSILLIVISALDGSFWGVFTSAMALALSILASAFLQRKK